ncbi:MAG: hypothetical protein PHZ23_11655 [Acidiphilium sp.]|nr:hypothetical protein [Acidiphilium sp.]
MPHSCVAFRAASCSAAHLANGSKLSFVESIDREALPGAGYADIAEHAGGVFMEMGEGLGFALENARLALDQTGQIA